MDMDKNLLTYLACICFLFIFGKVFIVPIKKIVKLICSLIFGGIIILLINIIGDNIGFHIGINLITSIIVGILGISGAICLIVIRALI